jgi:hypothetical protein
MTDIEVIKRMMPNYEVSARGGIFTTKARKRLMGIIGKTGRGRTKNKFWYNIRTYVRQALLDIQLFIIVADKNNLNQVLTKETVEAIIRKLLWDTANLSDPDLNKAEIAQSIIEWGFNYLRQTMTITLSHKRTIEEAIDLSKYLVEQVKPESERHYSTPLTKQGYY